MNTVPMVTNGSAPAIAPERDYGAITERVVIQGDLAKLTPEERTRYYLAVCDSVGLNPLTRPLEYITLNGKLTLYARASATDQLREKRHISVSIVARERIGELYSVTARAQAPDGRVDESTGVVALTGLKGDLLANALMKAETKSKRRVTLSICSLGFADETEVETIPGAERVERVERVEPVKPVAALPSLAAGPVEPRPTAEQLHLLVEFAQHFCWDPEQVTQRLQRSYRVDRFEDLTREQARRLLDGLLAKHGAPETWDFEAGEEREAIQNEGART